MPPTTFADLGLRDELLTALTRLDHHEPTAIQREAIAPLIAGRDLLGQAATGTGKTAAFALPLLQAIGAERTAPEPFALVLVPTRELALQVASAAQRYGADLGTRVLAVFGGQPFGAQLKALRQGVDLVVATPGRARDHIERGTLTLNSLRAVVLDEADEMLDMGFQEDLDAILATAPADRQTALFSATMPPRIRQLAARHLSDPLTVRPHTDSPTAGETPQIRQIVHLVPRVHRTAALARVLAFEDPTAAIVFCRTRAEVDEVTASLGERGLSAEALHGGLAQEQRQRVIARLRTGATRLLIATDVAARGLDIDQLTHVINLDLPSAPEVYVHRIGRVGRAGRSGVAITLAQVHQQRTLKTIERLVGQPLTHSPIPSAVDLQARRAQRLNERVTAALAGGPVPAHRAAAAELLNGEHDPLEVAAALLAVAHGTLWPASDDDLRDIPNATPRRREPRQEREHSGPRNDPRPSRARRAPIGPTGRVFIGAGRSAGVRPQDLVGAITGESSLKGREIGAIQIHDRFALVEVPAPAVKEVVRALRGTTIKGRKAAIRPEDSTTRR